MTTKNQFGKSTKIDNAYATYRVENPINGMYFVWKILKTYQAKGNEDKNKHARWFVACKSPMTHGSWDYGDTYIKDIMSVQPNLVHATNEWQQTYGTQN
jgi:hypothetical protein|tara:strand:+ start:288 stop:584 length:297 start_codon:yes stop_codon:yes gene_type:complete